MYFLSLVGFIIQSQGGQNSAHTHVNSIKKNGTVLRINDGYFKYTCYVLNITSPSRVIV